jgi:hypothetical protein
MSTAVQDTADIIPSFSPTSPDLDQQRKVEQIKQEEEEIPDLTTEVKTVPASQQSCPSSRFNIQPPWSPPPPQASDSPPNSQPQNPQIQPPIPVSKPLSPPAISSFNTQSNLLIPSVNSPSTLKSCLRKSLYNSCSPDGSPSDSQSGSSPTPVSSKKKRVVIIEENNTYREIPSLPPKKPKVKKEPIGPLPNQHKMRLRGARAGDTGNTPSTSQEFLEQQPNPTPASGDTPGVVDAERMKILKMRVEFEKKVMAEEQERMRKSTVRVVAAGNPGTSGQQSKSDSSNYQSPSSQSKISAEPIGPLKLKIKRSVTDEPLGQCSQPSPKKKSASERRQSFMKSNQKKVVENMEAVEASQPNQGLSDPLCKFCSKPAIDDPDWDIDYCSQICVVRWTKRFMQSFRDRKRLESQTTIETKCLPSSPSLTNPTISSSMTSSTQRHLSNKKTCNKTKSMSDDREDLTGSNSNNHETTNGSVGHSDINNPQSDCNDSIQQPTKKEDSHCSLNPTLTTGFRRSLDPKELNLNKNVEDGHDQKLQEVETANVLVIERSSTQELESASQNPEPIEGNIQEVRVKQEIE